MSLLEIARFLVRGLKARFRDQKPEFAVIRRHPDIRLRKSPSDIDKLPALQGKLLNSAWAMLKSRLYELELKKREEKASAENGPSGRVPVMSIPPVILLVAPYPT